MLSTNIRHYKLNGYCVVAGLLERDALLKTVFEMDLVLIQLLNNVGFSETPKSDLAVLHHHMRLLYAYDQSVYLQAIKLWAKLFSMQALVMSEKIHACTKNLGIELPIFQTSPVVHVMASDLRITGGYHGVGVHQDWPALQSGLDTVTVWFPFMDVDKHNFPVEVIPGSHRHGLFPGRITDHIFEIDPTAYREQDFVAVEANFGDVVFMSNFTLHRSSLVGDDRLRIACSSRYENAAEKTFIKRVYPSAQKRVIERELMQPDFPRSEEVEEVYADR